MAALVSVEAAEIARKALERKRSGLVIVTRNTKHFLPFGIAVLSPDEVTGEGSRA